MALATAAAIRDQVHTKIEAITPTSHSTLKFRRVRNEQDGKIEDWALKNKSGCLRRFQARQVGSDDGPTVSDTTTERVMLALELRVCYPQDGRFGSDNALDRDDAINKDWLRINAAVGVYGKSNFTTSTSGSYDCTPMPASMEMERGDGVDFMVVRLQYEYLRSIT